MGDIKLTGISVSLDIAIIIAIISLVFSIRFQLKEGREKRERERRADNYKEFSGQYLSLFDFYNRLNECSKMYSHLLKGYSAENIEPAFDTPKNMNELIIHHSYLTRSLLNLLSTIEFKLVFSATPDFLIRFHVCAQIMRDYANSSSTEGVVQTNVYLSVLSYMIAEMVSEFQPLEVRDAYLRDSFGYDMAELKEFVIKDTGIDVQEEINKKLKEASFKSE